MPFAVENTSRASAWVTLIFLTNLLFYAKPFPYCWLLHAVHVQNVQISSSINHTMASSMQILQHSKPMHHLLDLKLSYIQNLNLDMIQNFNCMGMSTGQLRNAEIHANGCMIRVPLCIVAPTNLSFIHSTQMQQNRIYELQMVNTCRWSRLVMWCSHYKTSTANTSKYCSRMSHTHQRFTRTFFRSAVYGMKIVFKQNLVAAVISNQTMVPNFCWIQIHHHIRFPRIPFLQLKNRSAREITRCGMRNLCMQAPQKCNSFRNIFHHSMDISRASVMHVCKAKCEDVLSQMFDVHSSANINAFTLTLENAYLPICVVHFRNRLQIEVYAINFHDIIPNISRGTLRYGRRRGFGYFI